MNQLSSKTAYDFDGLKRLGIFLDILAKAGLPEERCQYEIVDGKPSVVIRNYSRKNRVMVSQELDYK